jgi:hypothetical protein
MFEFSQWPDDTDRCFMLHLSYVESMPGMLYLAPNSLPSTHLPIRYSELKIKVYFKLKFSEVDKLSLSKV